ncbi:tryptophanase leader peptide [Aeromonas enteropelogenes]
MSWSYRHFIFNWVGIMNRTFTSCKWFNLDRKIAFFFPIK